MEFWVVVKSDEILNDRGGIDPYGQSLETGLNLCRMQVGDHSKSIQMIYLC